MNPASWSVDKIYVYLDVHNEYRLILAGMKTVKRRFKQRLKIKTGGVREISLAFFEWLTVVIVAKQRWRREYKKQQTQQKRMASELSSAGQTIKPNFLSIPVQHTSDLWKRSNVKILHILNKENCELDEKNGLKSVRKSTGQEMLTPRGSNLWPSRYEL